MRKLPKLTVFILLLSILSTSANAQQWSMKTAKLMTDFAADVDTSNVLGEYPRPQFQREKWLNLNGIWQYQPAASATEALPTGKLSSKILVPFPVESAISGVMEHHPHLWYRRSFQIPTDWAGQKILLNFGAVDYECEVFVNGTSVGKHEGGYDPFSFDITSFLNGTGAQDVALRVTDLTDAVGKPRGKQTLYPGGIMYTSVTGIWQTVWLEPVPQTSLRSCRIVPNIDNGTLRFSPVLAGAVSGLRFKFNIYDNGNLISTFEDANRTNITIPVPAPLKLWSPNSPFLYDMKVYLTLDNQVIDSVSTYFGMRKISMVEVGGFKKMMLNNEFVFQMGPLDQGFWPDGIYTAPTEEALKFDIIKTKELGFNMTRKHIKVEPLRWYYWADKLGLMVWQDMPSMNSYINTGAGRPVPPIDKAAYRRELEAMIKNLWNSPAIVSWVIFNEYQGAHDEAANVSFTKQIDNSRLVNVGSGGPFNDASDIRDFHNYPPPTYPKPNAGNTQALVCGEYGGIGYFVEGHIWQSGNPYETVATTAQLLERYTLYADMLIDYKSNKGMSAAVYTEITDVEMELNGFFTYDRKVMKGNIEDFYKVNQRIINENSFYTEVLPTSEDIAQSWKYTTAAPAANWNSTTYNDGTWQTGNGGFGTDKTPGAIIGTVWNTRDIWMRKTITLPEADRSAIDSLIIRLHHDEDCQVYFNGVKALDLTGFTGNYINYEVSEAAKNALVLGGTNVIAVHCRQTTGGQYIDMGLSILSKTKKPAPLSVKKNTKKQACRIFPNPAKNTIKIERSNPDVQVTGVYNISGSMVLEPEANVESIDISELSAGIYFLKFSTDGCSDQLRFVKN